MIAADLEDSIRERAGNIPIVKTLQMRFVAFDDGYCEINVPRKVKYDGVFESFHGGLFDDKDNLVAVAQVNYIILDAPGDG